MQMIHKIKVWQDQMMQEITARQDPMQERWPNKWKPDKRNEGWIQNGTGGDQERYNHASTGSIIENRNRREQARQSKITDVNDRVITEELTITHNTVDEEVDHVKEKDEPVMKWFKKEILTVKDDL